jgi:hypothetical protein
MPIDEASAKTTIMDFLEAKKGSKTKFYFNNFTELFPDAKPREVKKVLTALVNEGKMEYWSSGSTTLYGMTGMGKHAEGED